MGAVTEVARATGWLRIRIRPLPGVQHKFNKPVAGCKVMPHEPVLSKSELRSRVLQRIEDGRLPLLLSDTIDAGYGTGAPCDLCEQPISVDKIEYDVTDPRNGNHLHFHFACHSAWQRECARRIAKGRAAESLVERRAGPKP
jgi:hypothetical protein